MVKNQANQNSCTAAMLAGLLMLVREISGLDRLELSQATTYNLGNGGRDAGMSIDKALEIAREVGVVPVSVVSQYNWEADPPWPPNWRKIARRVRVLEAYDCPTYDHAVSAVYGGWPVGLGVYWKYPRRRGGHAVGMVDRRKKNDNEALGTWTEKYDDHGFHHLPDGQIEQGIPVFGAWAVRVTTDPTNEGDV